jgi:glycosyltransferase involved in cell wall biosynthesis
MQKITAFPEVTIAIPFYRRTTYFRKALDSALAQTIPTRILVHDASPEKAGFEELIGSDAIRVDYYHFNNDRGMAGNWNRSLELATTKWVSLLHDDDLLVPNAIELLTRAERERPGHALYFGLEEGIDKNGTVYNSKAGLVDHRSVDVSPIQLAVANQFCAAGVLLNREIALALGGFNSKLKMTPDWDLWLRLALDAGVVRVGEITARYRDYFDQQRETTAQELTAKKLLRLSVQLKRNIARTKARFPNYIFPPRGGPYVSHMAKGLLCMIGYRLTRKPRRIYFAYVTRTHSLPYKRTNKVRRCWAELFCWVYVAYSLIRPLRAKLRKRRNAV